MIRSRREPTAVPIRKYRYSKLRWRILVRILDAVGAVLMAVWRQFRCSRPTRRPARILLVQIDHLGDAVLTTALLPHLHTSFPEARIDVLASPSNRAIFDANRFVDRVIVAERNWFERRRDARALWSAVWSLGRRLRVEAYDLGIDVRGDVLTVLVLALARIPRRVGWTMGGGGFLLTDTAEWIPNRHEVRSRLALLDCIGGGVEGPVSVDVHPTDRDRARVGLAIRDRIPSRGPQPATATLVHTVATRGGARPRTIIPLDPDPSFEADSLHAGRFGHETPLLAVHLGAGTQAKRWPMRSWNALLALFLEDGWRVVVIGGTEDLDASRQLPRHPRIEDLTGQFTVIESAALLERADLFIGVDSGPAHLAASSRVTSVILFSGTNDHGQWRPWSRRTLVLKRRVPCRPCHAKECPLPDHPCMTGITPERVHAAARRWWRKVHHAESHLPPLS